MQKKKDLRKEMLEKRNELEANQKKILDRTICEKIEFLVHQDNIKVVHTFIPMAKEVNLCPLIDKLLHMGITVVSPKSLPQRKMENLILHSLSKLEEGIYGTKHPANSQIYTGKYDLIIVPGLAFDNNGNRLGYGAGYYDTFLNSHPDAFKLGVCYPFQVIDDVPAEEHDVKLDGLFY